MFDCFLAVFQHEQEDFSKYICISGAFFLLVFLLYFLCSMMRVLTSALHTESFIFIVFTLSDHFADNSTSAGLTLLECINIMQISHSGTKLSWLPSWERSKEENVTCIYSNVTQIPQIEHTRTHNIYMIFKFDFNPHRTLSFICYWPF